MEAYQVEKPESRLIIMDNIKQWSLYIMFRILLKFYFIISTTRQHQFMYYVENASKFVFQIQNNHGILPSVKRHTILVRAYKTHDRGLQALLWRVNPSLLEGDRRRNHDSWIFKQSSHSRLWLVFWLFVLLMERREKAVMRKRTRCESTG